MKSEITITIDHDKNDLWIKGHNENRMSNVEILVQAMTMDVTNRAKNSGKPPIYFWKEIDDALVREKLQQKMYKVCFSNHPGPNDDPQSFSEGSSFQPVE